MAKHPSKKKNSTRIAELREKAELTQIELAKEVRVTETTIANWENGRAEWIERVILVCDALRCSIQDLLVESIKELRKEAGITQLALAKSVGVRENTVRTWEKQGFPRERVENVIRLCIALGCVSPEDLLPPPPKKDEGVSPVIDFVAENLLVKWEEFRAARQPDHDTEATPDIGATSEHTAS